MAISREHFQYLNNTFGTDDYHKDNRFNVLSSDEKILLRNARIGDHSDAAIAEIVKKLGWQDKSESQKIIHSSTSQFVPENLKKAGQARFAKAIGGQMSPTITEGAKAIREFACDAKKRCSSPAYDCRTAIAG